MHAFPDTARRRRASGSSPSPASAPMLQLIINADDYALDASVDEAVLALARRGVVTATSAHT